MTAKIPRIFVNYCWLVTYSVRMTSPEIVSFHVSEIHAHPV